MAYSVENQPMNWVTLATAPDQIVAEMWREMLVAEGVPATLRPGDTTSFLGVTLLPCRVLVADNELARAKELLEDQMGVDLDET
jgi:hypothetical protein